MSVRRYKDCRGLITRYAVEYDSTIKAYRLMGRTLSGRGKPVGMTTASLDAAQAGLDAYAQRWSIPEDESCPLCRGAVEGKISPQYGRYSVGCGSMELLHFDSPDGARDYINENCTGGGRLGCVVYLKHTLGGLGVDFPQWTVGADRLRELEERIGDGMAKNTYHCACGRTFDKATNADSTGYRMDGYGPEHECYGCPFVLPIKEGYGKDATIKTYECRASLKEIEYTTATDARLDNNSVMHVYTLDLPWLQRFVAAYLAESGANVDIKRMAGRDFSGEDGQERYFRDAALKDGRRQYGFMFELNKRGRASKQSLFSAFFREDRVAQGSMGAELPRQTVQAQISLARDEARKAAGLPPLPPLLPAECPHYKGIVKSLSPRGWWIDCALKKPGDRSLYDNKSWAVDYAGKHCQTAAEYAQCYFYTQAKQKEDSMQYLQPGGDACPYYQSTQPKKGGGHFVRCGSPTCADLLTCGSDGALIGQMRMCGGAQKEECRAYLYRRLKEWGLAPSSEHSTTELRNMYNGYLLKMGMAPAATEQPDEPAPQPEPAREPQPVATPVDLLNAPPVTHLDDPPAVQPRPIADITAEIRFYKAQTVQNIIEIGRRLNEAKAQLEHGAWMEWLEKEVDLNQRAANKFMQLAREYPNWPPVANLPYSKLLALLAVPADEREEFIEAKHEVAGEQKTVEEMTRRQLETAIKTRDEALHAAQINEKVALERRTLLEKKDAEIARLRSEKKSVADQLAVSQRRARELESRPVDVAVAEPSEEDLARIREEVRAELAAGARPRNMLSKQVVERAELILIDALDGAVSMFIAACSEMDYPTAGDKLDTCINYLRARADDLSRQKNLLLIAERQENPDADDIDF